MNWYQWEQLQKQKIASLTFEEKFRWFACDLMYADYEWGKEGLLGTDCSGSISFPLLALGYHVRLTADAYMRELFTITVDHAEAWSPEMVTALFFVTQHEARHGDRVVPAGTATHVTPVVGEGVILDAAWGKQARLRPARDAIFEYRNMGLDVIRRGMSFRTLEQLDRDGQHGWGIDEPIAKLMEA